MPDKKQVQSLPLEATAFLSVSKKPQGMHSLMEGFGLIFIPKQSSAIYCYNSHQHTVSLKTLSH